MVSPSNTDSLDDLVPLAALKKGAHKHVLGSATTFFSGSKLPYVFGPMFLTRAHRNSQRGNPAISRPKPVAKTRFEVKDLSKRKLLKGSMVMTKLLLENNRLHLENKHLKAQLAQNEETTTASHNDLMNLIQSLSPLTMAFSLVVAQSSPSALAP